MATTSIDLSVLDTKTIRKRELLDYSADVKAALFRQIWKRFAYLEKTFQFSQVHLAKRLNVGKAVISRRLRGENDMRLETLSDLARGLNCRIDVVLTPFEQISVAELQRFPFKSPASVALADINPSRDGSQEGDAIRWQPIASPDQQPDQQDTMTADAG